MEWEFHVLNFFQQYVRNSFLDAVMPIVSFLGRYGIAIIIVFLVALISKKHKRLALRLVVSTALSALCCNLILKPIVNRMRPYELNTTIALIVKPETDSSFPSGHTFFAFSSATVCFMYNKKLGLVMYAYALMMAFSRLYLYVHFPTDVFFGALFGIIVGVIAVKMEQFAFSEHKKLSNKSY